MQLLMVPNEHMAGRLPVWPVVLLSRPRGAYIASIDYFAVKK
jgi:hypothetical protein